MNTAIIICVIILIGLSLGWVLHHRSVRLMMPILRRLAAEESGVVKSQNLVGMPKLLFSYAGTDVEVSSATTGIDGNPSEYTYILFKGLPLNHFEFRILPRSIQTIGDEWAGFKKPMAIDVGEIMKRLSIYTTDNRMMEAVLSENVLADLLFWASGERENRISDIRNYDSNLIYAVTGRLNEYEDYKLLLASACRFFDRLNNFASVSSRLSNESQPLR